MVNPGPHKLKAARTLLATSGDMQVLPVTPTFFQDLASNHPHSGSALISTFDFDEPWGVWEMHPAGDEFVYLLSGDTDFTLHDGKEVIGTLRVSTPGEYVVVPKGCWHTAHPHVPTSMLFITPGDGTVNANEPGGEPLQA
ncbi:MAG: cupin domain-containing protein [Pseudomonadota bacterium]